MKKCKLTAEGAMFTCYQPYDTAEVYDIDDIRNFPNMSQHQVESCEEYLQDKERKRCWNSNKKNKHYLLGKRADTGT